jgi:hypothetical protein
MEPRIPDEASRGVRGMDVMVLVGEGDRREGVERREGCKSISVESMGLRTGAAVGRVKNAAQKDCVATTLKVGNLSSGGAQIWVE